MAAGRATSPKPAPADLPIVAFPTAAALSEWLEENHRTAPGLWIHFYKKGSGVETVTYKEAVDEALCYGWIDGQVRSLDAASYLQRFTPRRPRSIWSKINRENVARLTAEGRMQPAGQREVERAQADGRWDAAYDSPKNAQLPEDFLAALERSPAAKASLETLTRQQRYAIIFHLHGAKRPETRARRVEKFIADLAAGRPIGG